MSGEFPDLVFRKVTPEMNLLISGSRAWKALSPTTSQWSQWRIPKFVLPSIQEQLQRGGPIKRLSFTIASWFRYLTGLGESGKAMPMLDPMVEKLRERAQAGGKDSRPCSPCGKSLVNHLPPPRRLLTR
jgi:hypothetical protein